MARKVHNVAQLTIEVPRYIVVSVRLSVTLIWKVSPSFPERRGPGSDPLTVTALWNIIVNTSRLTIKKKSSEATYSRVYPSGDTSVLAMVRLVETIAEFALSVSPKRSVEKRAILNIVRVLSGRRLKRLWGICFGEGKCLKKRGILYLCRAVTLTFMNKMPRYRMPIFAALQGLRSGPW